MGGRSSEVEVQSKARVSAVHELVHQAVHTPRKLWVRKALFQIHLWAGILVSVYVVVIALSGAVLVFEDELTSAALVMRVGTYDAARVKPIPEVMRGFAQVYPGARVTNLIAPWPVVPAYQLRAVGADGREFGLVADPATGAMRVQPRTWVNWVYDLHVFLLLGEAHGEQVNGVGAGILLVLAGTGVLLWWQGLKNWTRALKMNLRLSWRRINFDAHHAIGIWTLALVAWWSISGVYFGFYRQLVGMVQVVSPIVGMASPQVPTVVGSGRVALETVLAAAQAASPNARLFSVSDPSLVGTVVWAQMDRGAPADFSHRDIVTVDAVHGRVLTVWHYGVNHTLGDWFLWSMHPLHFGTLWGMAVKVLWFLVGISLAVLSATGVVMYWNRYLRHKLVRA